ncbi:MAG TPA: ABC transporter ATP-binding protein [Armatimonadota bacterium]|nr:ABC transporter ATP-binding protein [Armatimonadota bacterium]HPP73690.1 ABC transporter ATP-binding protein [Armatimonadota bacterium]
MNSIALDDVGKRIGHSWALREITFEINQGENFGVFGRAGSGKSTLLRLISGLDHPTTGTVVLHSSGGDDSSWLDAQTSMALQTPGLAPELTVAENLKMFASLWPIPRKGRVSRIAMYLELLGLVNVRNKQVRDLSPGMKAAAEVARALISNTDIIVIDGLIEQLDRPTRRRLWEYILARRRQNTTFIIGTASADEAALCDRLAVLSDGRLVFVGKPDDLMNAVQNEILVVESIHNPLIKSKLRDRFGTAVTERSGALEFRTNHPDADVAHVLAEIGSDVGCVYLRQPTLDDVLDRIEGD